MKLLVLLLMSLYTSSAWSQDFDFICGFSQMAESNINQIVGTRSSSTSVDYRSGQKRILILFSKFNGVEDPFNLRVLGDREGELNESAENLLNLGHEGSLAHYFSKMSGGILTLVQSSDGIDLTRYEATDGSIDDYYTMPKCKDAGTGLKRFVTEVIENANSDNSINFSNIDVVAVITPKEFVKCKAGTIFSAKFGAGIQIDGDDTQKPSEN